MQNVYIHTKQHGDALQEDVRNLIPQGRQIGTILSERVKRNF